MKIYDRLILAIYSICLAIISFIIIILPFNMQGVLTIEDGMGFIDSMRGNYWYSLIGLVFFLVSVRFIFSGITMKDKDDDQSFLVMRNEFGEILIYEETIIGLVENVASKFSGIRNIKTKVNLVDGMVDLNLNGEVSGEMNIPELAFDLQQGVKEHIESITGAKTGQIKVEIGKVTAPTSRVR